MEDRRIRRFGRRSGATLLTLGLALGGFSVFAPGAGADGNNGTVKVGEDIVLDGAAPSSNDPKIQCPIVITWFGFDGDASTTATITSQGGKSGGTELASYSWSIPDTKTTPTQQSIDPDLTGATVGPNGYHIRITVETTTANGPADTKSKVLWVKGPCGETTPVEGSSSFVVTKSVVGDHSGSFDFVVDCGDATPTPDAFSLGDGEETTVTVDSADAECDVVEADDGGADSTTWAIDGGDGTEGTTATVAPDAETPPVVAFTNTFDEVERGQATLEIGKTVVGTGTGPFVFSVDCGNSTVSPSTTVTVAAGTTETVTVAAPPTGNCTVTETDDGNATSTAWSASDGGAGSGTVADVDIHPNETSSVSFVNTFVAASCSNCSDGGIIPVVTVTPDVPVVNNPAPTIDTQVITPAPAEVAGEQIVAPAPAQSVVLGTELARTGAMTDRLIVAAGLCLLLGGLALVASKERTAVPTRRR